tara:strand:+ start:3433 stop:3756 length:324 start_codon:yes stop_codon:yes gene_type:complete
MLLGHTAFSEQAFQDARLDAIFNNSFGVTQSALTFSLGTEVATGGASVEATGDDLQFTASLGDEDAFGGAFSSLIELSVNSPNFFIWNETDDSETSTWKDVEPGSTD